MAKSKKKKVAQKDSIRILKAFLISALSGVGCFFILTAAAALLLLNRDLSDVYYMPFILFSSTVSGFVSGFVCLLQLKKNGLIMGMLSSLPVYLIIMIVSMGVSRSGIGIYGWICPGIMMLTAGAGGIVSANKRSKTKIK